MSRVGKNPVPVPDGVTVDVSGQTVTAKGKLGMLSKTFTEDVDITLADREVRVAPRGSGGRSRKMWGTTRSLIDSMVAGVSEGFTRILEIQGIGYRSAVQGKELVLQLGYSHEIRYPIPQDIDIECPEQTRIMVKGADKQKVGQVASEIRGFRPPEPYKGKGVRYSDEYVLRKEGKKK